MRRIVNMRTMLIAAVSETAVILCMYLCGINIFAGIAVSAVILAVYVAAGVASIKFSKKKLFAALVFSFVLAAVTVTVYEVRYAIYNTVTAEPGEISEIIGTVDSVSEENGTVKSVSVTDVRINGKKISGKVNIFISESFSPEEIPIGYKLSTQGNLYPVLLRHGATINGTAYRKNLRYLLYPIQDTIQITPQKAGLTVRIRAAIYTRLRSACGSAYGSVAYCMLTGDKNELDTTTLNTFSVSGIGHVLAVSGLHVGLITATAERFMRKIRIPRLPRIITVGVMLFVYSAFVGFASSVVRASVMCMIGLVTMVNGQRKDALSSLCFTYSVILTAEPFLLFEVGFLMSFSAVFGLVLFAKPFFDGMRKIHIPKFIANPISVAASAYIGVFPVSAYFFGAVQTYSLIFNLLLVPLLSAVFVVFALFTPLCVLFKLNLPLKLCGAGLAVADLVAGFASVLPVSTLAVRANGAIFLLYAAYFAASRFLMIPRHKRLVSLCIFITCAAVVVVPSAVWAEVPKALDMCVILPNSYKEVTTVVVDSGAVTVIGDVFDAVEVYKALNNNGIRRIDTVILNRLDERSAMSVAELAGIYKIGTVLCPSDCIDNNGLALLGGYKDFYLFEERAPQNVERVLAGSRHAGYIYTFGNGVSMLNIGYSSRYVSLDDGVLDSAPIIRCFMYLNYAPDRIYLTNMPLKYLMESPGYGFTTADLGSFVFNTSRGVVLE